MWIVDQAKKFISAKWFSASSPVTTQAFVIQQGQEMGVTRPLGFAPDGYYIEDLGFFLSPGQRQDMGALFTQKQLNESFDLKCALVNGDLLVEWGNSADTVPIADPSTFVGSVTIGDPVGLKDISGTQINPATKELQEQILAVLEAEVSDLVFSEEVKTIDALGFTNYALARTAEPYAVKNLSRKTFVLVNTGASSVFVRGYASLDEGLTYPLPLLTETHLAPGGVIMVDEDIAFTDFKFEVKRNGADSEVTSYGYAYHY